jgi:hypothetical protein
VPGNPLRPEKDRIIVAWLHGAANRHAGWRRPEGEAHAAAMAELRDIATDRKGHLRADLLAEAAGICRGVALAGGLSTPQMEIMAELLVDAGADPDLVDEWVPIGLERADRKRHS